MSKEKMISLAMDALDDLMEMMDAGNIAWASFYAGKAYAYIQEAKERLPVYED